MITVLLKNLNAISQKSYDGIVGSIQLFNVTCTCGTKGCLIRYGHYHRHVKLSSSLISLRIQRVWCKHCGTSHAILLSALVPYSQIILDDQQQILLCLENRTYAVPEPPPDKVKKSPSFNLPDDSLTAPSMPLLSKLMRKA